MVSAHDLISFERICIWFGKGFLWFSKGLVHIWSGLWSVEAKPDLDLTEFELGLVGFVWGLVSVW